ncbi:MAG: SDR family oxidoreductase [Candidatus Schekmanbacteria bacterium]|nr:MAG: SDR family oxidoreductase [Candidatus Schekmanbacteria bacterium]
MCKKLKNRVALITGGGTGIGKGIAKCFCDEGAIVYVMGRRLEKLEDTVNELNSDQGKAFAIQGDVSKKEDIERVTKEILNKEGKIDILVNNAGIEEKPEAVYEMSEASWDKIFSVNIKGVFLMTKAVSKIMIDKKIKGKIINISSITSKNPPTRCSAYASSKAAVNIFTFCAAADLGQFGINVNCICPGMIQTPMLESIDNNLRSEGKMGMTDIAEIMISTGRLPKGRIGQPEDIGKVAVFLASDDSEYMTGQVLNVCGGITSH